MRAAAGVLDDVHGGHGEAGAVDHAGDGAVELDVVEAELGGFDFERIFFVEIAQFAKILVAEERVVVEGHLGVERDELAVAGEDEGIDFEQRGVGVDERAMQAPGKMARLACAASPVRPRPKASLRA